MGTPNPQNLEFSGSITSKIIRGILLTKHYIL